MKNPGEGMKHFPAGRERKKVIADNARRVSIFKRGDSAAGLFYDWVDSSIEEDMPGSFNYSFYKVLPRGPRNVKEYIEQILKKKKGNAIGVEFGGPGERLFKKDLPELFKKSIGITLLDRHKDDVKPNDTKSTHEVLEGDILDDQTYVKLEEKLEGHKIDFIISRMAAGLEYIPIEPYIVSRILHVWYKLLNEEGIMLVQTPVFFNKLLKEWAVMLQTHYKDVLEFQEYASGEADGANTYGTHSNSAFRLRKLEGAPAELPFLDPRIVKDIQMGTGHWD